VARMNDYNAASCQANTQCVSKPAWYVDTTKPPAKAVPQRARRRRQSKPPSSRGDGLDSQTRANVQAVLKSRWYEAHGVTIPTSELVQQDRPVAESPSGRLSTVVLEPWNCGEHDMLLAEKASQTRADQLRCIFGGDKGKPSPLWMSSGYRASLDAASVVVVSLPPRANKKAPKLTDERAVAYVDAYGKAVWNGWTLAAWYRTSLEHLSVSTSTTVTTATVSTTTTITTTTTTHQDMPIQMGLFAVGLLYQAKYGFRINANIGEMDGYASHKDAILKGIAQDIGSTNTDEASLLCEFAQKRAMMFLTRDVYLEDRLVTENHIGSHGTTIDGHIIESSFVNQGIGTVVQAFSHIAKWSLRKLVDDIASGMQLSTAFGAFNERSALMLVR
jgi:hypothetical protein